MKNITSSRFLKRAFVAAAGLCITGWTTAAGRRADGALSPDVVQPVDSTTRVQMQNVDFYIDPQIPLHIRHLRGTMRAKIGGPVVFDDNNSFIIHLDDAEVGLTGPNLSNLLNKYVFNFPGSPLRHLVVTTKGNQIVQKGILRKVVDMPFEITAGLSLTSDGRIKIHPTKTVILGLHVDQLMNGLGLNLDKIIDLRKSKGASVSGNDIYLDPTRILPPPAMEGRLTSVRVENGQVVQTFGQSIPAMAVPDASAANYMFYKGGSLRFGKLLMSDAELQIVDLDPADPFRFDLTRYLPQLVAGYSRTLPSGGLEAFMRDVDKLDKPRLEGAAILAR